MPTVRAEAMWVKATCSGSSMPAQQANPKGPYTENKGIVTEVIKGILGPFGTQVDKKEAP